MVKITKGEIGNAFPSKKDVDGLLGRPSRIRSELKRKRMKRRAWKIFRFLVFVAMLAGVYVYASHHRAQIDAQELAQAKIEAQDRIEQMRVQQHLNMREMEDEVLATLAGCETGGVADQDGALIMDTNNEFSIGRYQWQRPSVKYYIEKLEDRKITNQEAIMIAVDYDRATELTRKVLFQEPEGWRNWYNCSRKHNLASRIEAINKIR
jgi:hypothetical protein